MKFRSTLVLGLVFAALCGIYFGAQKFQERGARRAEAAKRLFTFEAPAVQALEVLRLNEPPCAAERTGEGPWAITKPDASIVPLQALWSRMAQHVAALTNERTIAKQAANAADYGLEAPALTVQARLASGENVHLRFGNLDPTESFRYAQQDNGPVFLVTKNAFFELDRSLNDLRDRFLWNDRESPLLRFEFARIWTGRKETTMDNPPALGAESVTVVFERPSKDAPWRMRAPVEAPANQEKVDELVKQVQYAMGEGYVDKPASLKDYGLEPASLRIAVADARDGTPQTLFIGDKTDDKTGKVYARRADRTAVFLVDGHLLNLFPKSPDAFRERRLITRPVTGLKKVEYRARGGAGFVLEKDPQGGWALVEPQDPETSPVALSDYIAAFKWVECSSFPGGPMEQYGLNDPDATLALAFDGTDTPALLRFKAVPNDATGMVYATQDTGDVLMLTRESADAVMGDALRFRSKQLMRFSKTGACKIEFQLDNQGYVLEKAHDQWVVTQPPNKILEHQSDVEALVEALAELNAVAEVKDPPEPPALGLDAPVFTVCLTTRAANATPPQESRFGPLRVGKTDPENSGRRYARCEGRSGVFLIKQELMDTVREMCRGIREP